jgi:hypothetical protein
MRKSPGSVTIEAPVEKVFDVTANPEIVSQISSDMVVGNKDNYGELGSYSDWDY